MSQSEGPLSRCDLCHDAGSLFKQGISFHRVHSSTSARTASATDLEHGFQTHDGTCYVPLLPHGLQAEQTSTTAHCELLAATL